METSGLADGMREPRQSLSPTYYCFTVRPGANAAVVATGIGSALLDDGFATTVPQSALRDLNAPQVFASQAFASQIFASQILLGLVGLILIVGTAALLVTGRRAVTERRQRIGMLRALGFQRRHIILAFEVEALIVAAVGAVAGLAVALALCRVAFAVTFFAQDQAGLTLVVPWPTLLAICGVGMAAAFSAAIIPAWRSATITPADALRYE